MALLSLEQVRDGVLADPSLYAQKIDFAREAMLFLRLDKGAYRAASFLDDRILTQHSEGRWVRFAELAPWLAGAPPGAPLHFIFHAGHVGSTLVSRLLEEAGGVLALREPLPLRTLAEAHDEIGAASALLSPERFADLLGWQLQLWRRGYADTRVVIVKATSSAGRLCPALLEAQPNARALYLNLDAEPYLATLLAGENSYLDLRGFAPERIRRLERLGARAPSPLYAMSLGEIAALTWAVERLTQLRAEQELGERVLSLDFDAFLHAPGEALRRVCAHFRLEASEAFFAGAAESGVMKRYSKAPEHAYTPQFRGEILTESRTRNGGEIRKGLLWLEQLARSAPEVAGALSD
jgi:hypothetical protein